MSIIGKKLGNAETHNGKILEHNRHRPKPEICRPTTQKQLVAIRKSRGRKTGERKNK